MTGYISGCEIVTSQDVFFSLPSGLVWEKKGEKEGMCFTGEICYVRLGWGN